MCQDDVENIIKELNLLEREFTQAFPDAKVRKDQEIIVEKYMVEVLEVLDRSDPHRWSLVDAPTRANASTRIQKSLTSASLAIATTLYNESVNYTSRISDSLILRQKPSYYTPRNIKYKHKGLNNTDIQLPINFYQSYTDAEGLVTVLLHSFTKLHSATNSVPCDPSMADMSEVSATGQVNSVMMGSTVKEQLGWKAVDGEEVLVTLEHIYSGEIYHLGAASCVWWDDTQQDWSTAGCWVLEQTHHYTRCACDHLTNLAVIMDIHGLLSRELHMCLRWVSLIGCSVSSICLVLTICCLTVAIRAIKRSRGQLLKKVHLHLCVCLVSSEVVLMLGLEATDDNIVCKMIAALLHYFFLATFMWSFIEAFKPYLMLSKVFTSFNKMKYFMMVGYGFPLVFVSAALVATRTRGYGTYQACWLKPGSSVWLFTGPLLTIIMVNVVSYICAIKVTCGKQPQIGGDHQSPTVRLKISISLFFILGLTWIPGFFYIDQDMEVMAVMFTVVNSLQGAAIFVITVLMDKQVLKEINSLRIIRSFTRNVRRKKHQPNSDSTAEFEQRNFFSSVELAERERI
ncbi:putative adhesion G protein-coupled receptor E4P [Cherax quadricarinatus]